MWIQARDTRVQFREDDDVVRYVEGLGENPNEVARRAFEQEVPRMKAREARARLRKMRIGKVDSASAIRRVRDSRHG